MFNFVIKYKIELGFSDNTNVNIIYSILLLSILFLLKCPPPLYVKISV